MGIDATVPFGFESDFLRPAHPIDKVTLDDFFTDDRIANAKGRMIETARELECDEDEGRFNETLKRIAPKKDESLPQD